MRAFSLNNIENVIGVLPNVQSFWIFVSFSNQSKHYPVDASTSRDHCKTASLSFYIVFIELSLKPGHNNKNIMATKIVL